MIKFVRVASFLLAAVVTIFSIFLIDGEKELSGARKAFKSGDMDQAIRMARRANRSFSEDEKKASAYYIQAQATAQMQWTSKAKDYLNNLLEINENHISGLLFRGEIENKLGNYTNALQDLDKGLSLSAGKISDNNLANSLSTRGLVYLKLDQLENAEMDARRALQLAPNLHKTHDVMSHIYEKKENYEAAVEACSQAYKLLIENDRYAVVSPEGRKYSDRLVNLKVKHLQSQ